MTDDSRRSRPMRPRARLMLTIGQELISSETVALIELVKNAFDADAHFVLVRLDGVVRNGTISAGHGTIEVLDDGVGMTPDTIASTWLEPATPSRRRHRYSQQGRRLLGEKGVGRFAAAKLAEELQLVSRVANGSEVEVRLNWADFEDEEKYLDQVNISWTERSPNFFAGDDGEVSRLWQDAVRDHLAGPDRSDEGLVPTPTHGTLLRMGMTRGEWTRDSIAHVRTSLSRLVSPFPIEQDLQELTIVLDVPPALGLVSGVVEPPEELQRPHYTLNASIDVLGRAVGTMTLKNGERSDIDTQLHAANDEIPTVESPLRCGPFEIRLRVWDRDLQSLADIAGDASPGSVRNILNDAAGVSIYRDGFRVLPYGEPGDDWLGLDLRRVQSPTKRLSNNQIVGYLLVGRDTNPDLVDQTNREGLVEGPALADLRSTVRQLLVIIEAARYRIRPRAERRHRGGLLDRIDLGELKTAITERIPDDQTIVGMVSDLQGQIDARQHEVGEVLARYHRLATLGQLVDRIVHELSQPLLAARQASLLALEQIDRSAPDIACVGKELVGDLQERLATIKDQTRAASDVLRRIEPFGGRRRGRPPKIKLENAVADSVALLQQEIDRVGAKVRLPQGSTTVTVDGTELQEVIVNLLTNSIYWLRHEPRGKRQIAIDVGRNADGSVSLTVEDSGPGVDPSNQAHIFEPYFTTREGGVGLGLSIAGEIVEDFYGGSLELLPPTELGGARFRATLRKRVAQ